MDRVTKGVGAVVLCLRFADVLLLVAEELADKVLAAVGDEQAGAAVLAAIAALFRLEALTDLTDPASSDFSALTTW